MSNTNTLSAGYRIYLEPRVIAILLGVLGFSIEAATIFFLRLCEETAIDKKMDPDVRSEKLVAVIKSLLSGIGVSEESRFQGEINWGDGCKVYVIRPQIAFDI